MVSPIICSLLESADTDALPFPHTDIFNETWLVRLIVDWFARNNIPNFPLSFADDARWFSEASLPAAFLARKRGDSLAESRTQADAVIGHFNIGSVGKTDCAIKPDAKQFIVIEAKLFSPLTPNVKNATDYDQCARTVACIAETLHRAGCLPESVDQKAFYVLAPESQINAGLFTNELQKESIHNKVKQRVNAYNGSLDSWFSKSFEPLLEQIDIQSITWESVIHYIQTHDPDFAHQVGAYYGKCLKFNGSISKTKKGMREILMQTESERIKP